MSLKLFVLNLPAMICYIAAGVLAFSGIVGWGWFLFIGLLCTVCISKTEEKQQ